jgi:hypothetical protein
MLFNHLVMLKNIMYEIIETTYMLTDKSLPIFFKLGMLMDNELFLMVLVGDLSFLYIVWVGDLSILCMVLAGDLYFLTLTSLYCLC